MEGMNEEQELKTVRVMIAMASHHYDKTRRKELSPRYQELYDYVRFRLSKCPWDKKRKPFCSNCPIHCYEPEKREEIRKVMRYSGPRMMFTHPILCFRHVNETLEQRRKMRKDKKKEGVKNNDR